MRRRLSRFALVIAVLQTVSLLIPSLGAPVGSFAPAHALAAGNNPIVLENQQPGSTGWQIDSDNLGNPLMATNHQIEGYASLTSVNKGGQISLMVSLSSSAQYTMQIYRMGYYPTGTNPDGTPCAGPCGGRLMQTIGPLSGSLQPACPTTTTTTNFGLIECNWASAYALTVPTTWTTGNYIVKLRRNDSGLESYITFVVRDDAGAADIVLSMDVTTWQAYNFWGGSGNNNVGYSLYGKFNDVSYANLSNQRAYAVSFNRPYLDQGEEDGAGNFMVWDYPMVRWLESQGYNVTYATNVDVETNPGLLVGRKAFINTGHDEYYSDNMRANLQGYINGGAHAAFFSANNVYYRVRWANSSSGQADRRIICYKDASLDPQSPPTLRWRDLSPAQPENAVIGVMQNGVANDRAFRVFDSTSWIYAGTGLVNYVSGNPVTSGAGQNAIRGLVGYEFDERAANDSSLSAFVPSDPPGLQQVAHSAVPASDNGVAAFSDATLYTASSGAIVFAAGTIQWSWGLDNGYNDGFCDCNLGYANSKSQQITTNILNRVLNTTTSPAAVTLNPASLTFASQAVNTKSATQAVTLTNSGGAPLTINSIGITGTNAGDFAQTNVCPLSPTTLAAGASCSITVTFAPTATGSRSASISINDSASGSPHTVTLSGTGASAPVVTLSPTSLTFTHQQINTTSAAQMIALTNSGSAPLTINSIGITGNNPTDFGETTTCALSPNTLAAGGSCTVNVTFTPSASGSRTANLSVNDNAGGSPHTATLSGTGTATPVPAVSLAPASLTFSSQTVNTSSSPQAVTLTNTGNAPLTVSSVGMTGTNAADFSQTNNCPVSPNTLAAGLNCAINVTFKPSASGSRTANLSINDDASGSPQAVGLSGTGAVSAGTYLSDGFESGNLSGWKKVSSSGGKASVQTTAVNSGTDAAALTNSTNTDYIGLNANLSGGAHAQTYSRFCFRLAGLSGSTVLAQGRDVNGANLWELDYDAGRKGLDIYFWNGARARSNIFSAANLLLPNSWYCAEVQANESSTGHGEVWLNGTSVAKTDTDLSATNAYTQLYLWNNGAAGTVNFDDVQVANTYNGPVGAGSAPLPAPAVTLSPTTLTFASQQLGTSSTSQPVTLTNSGNAPLTINGITLTGANSSDYSQTNTCPLSPSTLAAGGSCMVSVTFTPSATGSRSASLSIADNATGTPQTTSLSGTGISPPAPAVSLSPTSLTFSSQLVNSTSAAQTITLTNSGNAPLTMSSIGIAGTNAGDYSQSNTCPLNPNTLAAGSNCTISVTFKPNATGTRSATLSINDNAGGSPHTASLGGTGTLPAGTYLVDGFESGLGVWSTAGNGSATVQSAVVNSGSSAAALTNASGQYIGLNANLAGGGQAQTYSRFCFRLSNLSGSGVLAQGRDANGANLWEVDYDAGTKGLDIYFWNGARTRTNLTSPPNLVLPDFWYCAEVQANESSTGHGEVWLNGTSVAKIDTDLSAASPYSQLFLWNNGPTGTIYFDDVLVSNSYNGPVGAGAGALPSPSVSLSSPSLSFGNQTVSTTSGSQPVTLTNSGNAPLTINSVTLTGTNAGDYSQTNTCPTSPSSLAAGSSCTINVTFTPSAMGSRSASISISDSAGGSPHTVSLSGNGVAPASPGVTLSPTSLTFAGQQLNTSSAAQTITLTNSGNAPLTMSSIGITGANAGDYSQSNTCPLSPSSLAANSSCAINVTFAPAAAGSRVATLSISDNAGGSPHTASLGGTGTLPAGTYLVDGFESGLGVWSTAGNGSATVQSAVVNSGSSAAALTNASGQYIGLNANLAGGAQSQTYSRFCFRLSNLSGSGILAQGRDVNGANLWEVDYDAGTKGLDIYFWNGARTRTNLTSPSNLVLPDFWYCAEVQANESSTGHGEVWLNGTSVAKIDTDLSAASPYSQLFLWNNGPTGTVYFDDVLVSNSYNGPVGAGAGALPLPVVTLSPTSLSFANQTVNTTSASQTITLTNSGGAPLTISGIGITGANAGDYSQSNTCPLSPSTLAAGSNCSISVTFTPTATGSRSASLSINDNGIGNPHSVSLMGTGT